jgi:hypothetical protein
VTTHQGVSQLDASCTAEFPAMAFPNVYTHRKVADTKAKSCDICYKLSTSVLITADNKVRPLPPLGPVSSLTLCRIGSTSAPPT